MVINDVIWANPLLLAMWNSVNISSRSGIPQLLSQMGQTPQDYAILAPISSFLEENIDLDSNKSYTALSGEMEFVMGHVIRISALKNSKIRSDREYSTLNGKSILIRNDLIVNGKGWKHDFAIRISSQKLINFPQKDSISCAFHVIFIEEALIGNPKPIFKYNGKSLLLEREDLSQLIPSKSNEINHDLPNVIGFDSLLSSNPNLSEFFPKFHQVMSDIRPRKCTNLIKLHQEFNGLMKKGLAIINTIQPSTINKLYETNSINDYHDLQLSVLSYLESNVYDRVFPQILRLNILEEDNNLIVSYEYLKYISITQIGLSRKLWNDHQIRNELIIRTNTAISCFKRLTLEKTSIMKCSVILDTIKLLTTDTVENEQIVEKLDADSILCLLIYVICHAQIPDLSNQLYYIHTYFNQLPIEKDLNLTSGYIGYILSTLEIALNYFNDSTQRDGLIQLGRENYELWNLINDVKPSRTLSREGEKIKIKLKNEELFICINEKLINLYDNLETNEGEFNWSSSLFARNSQGHTYISMSLNKRNEDLMDVLFELNGITLDDLIEEVDIKNRSVFTLSMELNHLFTTFLVQMLLGSKSTKAEVEKLVNMRDYKGRTMGHLITGLNNWEIPNLEFILQSIDWSIKDKSGFSSFMSLTRAYDHYQYENIVCKVIDILYDKYHGCDGFKFTMDHLDSKGNNILHGIRSPRIMNYILERFNGNEIDLNHLNHSGVSAICLSVKYSRLETLRVLINDPRIDIKKVDGKSFIGVLDYIKLDNNPSGNDKLVEKLVEHKWRSNKEFICVRGRFEQELGFCLHLKDHDETVVIPFRFLKNLFKMMKRENQWIPFIYDFNWIPQNLDIEMKGNIQNSNKLKINTLVLNINLIWECFKGMNILDHVTIWKDVITNDETKICDDFKLIKKVTSNINKFKLNIIQNFENFRSIIVSKSAVESYAAFVNYSIKELHEFQRIYEKLHTNLISNGIKLEGDMYLGNNIIPREFNMKLQSRSELKWINNEESIIKLRILYNLTKDLISIQLDLKGRLIRWLKINKVLNHIKTELLKLEIELKDNKTNENNTLFDDILVIIEQCHTQVDALLGMDDSSLESVRLELEEIILKQNGGTPKIGEIPTIGLGYSEKRRVVYINKLIKEFLKLRMEIFDLDIDISNGYETIAEFVSKFYEFKVNWTKDLFREYSKQAIWNGREIVNTMIALKK